MTYVIEGAIIGAIIGLILLIGSYLVFKTMRIEEFITNCIENVFEDITRDEKLQKNLYTIGALIGNGAKSGFGLQKRAGKMSMTDLIVQSIAGKFLGGANTGTETVKSEESVFKVE